MKSLRLLSPTGVGFALVDAFARARASAACSTHSVIRIATVTLAIVIGIQVVSASAQPDTELRVIRVDFFENHAGSFLAVEVFDPQVSAIGSSGPSPSFAWRTAMSGYGAEMEIPRFRDIRSMPPVYLFNRVVAHIGDISMPAPPVMIRVTSTAGTTFETPVRRWLDKPLAPRVPNFQTDFSSRYTDATEVNNVFDSLAAQFPDLVSAIRLPLATNGYRRKSTCVMDGSSSCGSIPDGPHLSRASTSKQNSTAMKAAI